GPASPDDETTDLAPEDTALAEFRKKADGKLQTARKLVPQCLDSCNITTIRHFWRKSWRYMDAYMKGLTGKQAEFAVKKYKSH
ncbi:hypothetical protein FRC11_001376, partial [Ceratobasidium sp. 423]